MDKYDIFDHLAEFFLYSGKKNKFECKDEANKKYVLSRFPSAPFNFVSFGELNRDLINQVLKEYIPFFCFPRKDTEHEFEAFAAEQGLIKADVVMANKFDNLQTWDYQANDNIEIKKITEKKDLEIFDYISSICFQHEITLAYKFLWKLLDDENFTFFLAYYNNKPVGAGISSYLKNMAGIYWSCVLPEFRNKGIGSELTKYRMNYSKNLGFDSVVAQSMTMSAGYYKKIGFKEFGSFPLYMNLN